MPKAGIDFFLSFFSKSLHTHSPQHCYRMHKFLIGLLCLPLVGSHASIDLSGEWRFALDPEDQWLESGPSDWDFTDTITLPGTTARAGKGSPLEIELNLEKPTMQHLHQKFAYIGPAWYQRSVEIPAEWQGQNVELLLERVIWETQVWVNGEPVGSHDSLSTPHRHSIGDLLKAGQKNTLTIRVDNRERLPIGIGHAYTEETQSIWNGVVGELSLTARPKVHLSHLRLRPDLKRQGVTVTVEIQNNTGDPQAAQLELQVADDYGSATPAPFEVAPGLSARTVFVPMAENAPRWSEFEPVLHEMTANLSTSVGESMMRDSFGLRSFEVDGRKLLANGKPTFLRGNLECSIFPKTGHPDMTGAEWTRIFETAREFGLNHFRFHSYCPPKAAFEAADRLGIYLQVELPNWSFEMGERPAVDAFFIAEGERIFREYGNHPSFVMFALGNELTGDLDAMDQMIAHFRSLEPDMLYTSTSYSFSPRGRTPGPEDDFFVTQRTTADWVRGQGFLNQTSPNTMSDYSKGLSSLSIPLISHEVGQYNNYPNLKEIDKYEEYGSPFRPTAWEAIRKDLKSKGRLHEAQAYTRDSGKLAAILYKEDIERALRTPDQAGIQLLQLQDFPGQSTATVGLVDSFWESKGLITPEEFRRFNAPTVPLARMVKMNWQNSETFEAKIEVAHFGPNSLHDVSAHWILEAADKTVGKGSFTLDSLPLGNGIELGRIRQDLSSVATAQRLTLTVRIPAAEAENSWSIWVYPEETPGDYPESQSFITTRELNPAVLKALANGETVLLLPSPSAIKKPLPGRFIPVFWSPLHFPNQPGTLGATIDSTHPVFADFPTDTHTDWQWWELLATSKTVDLSELDAAIVKPFRFVDKYNRNAMPTGIFEAQVGSGKLLVCTLDVVNELDSRLAARQLRRSLENYIGSPAFTPEGELTSGQLQQLIGERSPVAHASTAHNSHPASNILDENPKTFWHSDWREAAKAPFTLEIDLQREQLLEGFRYLPRQDEPNGRIKKYTIEVSLNGEDWTPLLESRTFPGDASEQTVTFDKVATARFFRLTIIEGVRGHGSVASLQPITASRESDVRDLGIIPGFNQ